MITSQQETFVPGRSSTGLMVTNGLIVALVVCGGAAAFVYAGGWLSPDKVTATKFMNSLETLGGHHPGYRRNHAKGLGFTGYFESNGSGERISKATVFQERRSAIVGRFSLSGGNPYATDSLTEVRGFALQFISHDGQEWRTAMISLPVFPVSTPESFHARMMASIPDPGTGKPDPAAMDAFTKKYPETVAAGKLIGAREISSDFANTTFNSINAFFMTNAAGERVPVRWQFVPEEPFVPADTTQTSPDKSFLFDSVAAQIKQHPLRWHLYLIVGKPDVVTKDPTIPWTEPAERIDVGTLTINTTQNLETAPATDLNFDPLVLPAGIEPSDDPFPSARSAIYSQSFTRRAGETREPHEQDAAHNEQGK